MAAPMNGSSSEHQETSATKFQCLMHKVGFENEEEKCFTHSRWETFKKSCQSWREIEDNFAQAIVDNVGVTFRE